MADVVTLEKKQLGRSGPLVSAMGLGCMGMSTAYGQPDDRESIETIRLALDLGVNFLDTADSYGPFTNEVLVGRAIRDCRARVVLATKFGIIRSEDPLSRVINGKPEYVRSACEASLRRLGVETIDLYYLHRLDENTPIEDTVDAMSRLVREGKIRFLGLSEVGAAILRRAHAIHPITALQSEYSLWTRDPEGEILAACRELGIGFVAFSPLGRGFLTGEIKRYEDFAEKDLRRLSPRFQGENFQKNLQLVECIRRLAEQKNCLPGQLALAWLLAQGTDIVPLFGTKKRTYLRENLGALHVTLTAEDRRVIDAVMPPAAAAGARYPEAVMRFINR